MHRVMMEQILWAYCLHKETERYNDALQKHESNAHPIVKLTF